MLLTGLCPVSNAQTKPQTDARTQPRQIYLPRERTIEVWGGMAHPFNHKSFKRYWMRGPAAGFSMHFRASDHVKIGFGAEATLFSFRAGNFTVWNPTVPVQVKDIVALNVFLSMRRYFRPALRTSPFIGGEIGFTRVTGAEYKDIVNAVRVTYYEVPASFRLTASACVGIDHYLSRTIAVQGEVHLTYLHNDPNVGLFVGGRAGLKFTL
jgi:hypothetical protein